MQVVFLAQAIENRLTMGVGDQGRGGEVCFQVFEDIVALNMHLAIVYQYRYQAPWINTYKPGREVFLLYQVHRVGGPVYALQVQEYAGFLGAGRSGEMQEMHALPVAHLPSVDIFI